MTIAAAHREPPSLPRLRPLRWVVLLLGLNAAAILVLLQLPPLRGLAWVVVLTGSLFAWHLAPGDGRRRLRAALRVRLPAAPVAGVGVVCLAALAVLAGTTGLLQATLDFRSLPALPGWESIVRYQDTTSGLVAVLLLLVVGVPAFEEFVFRGRLLRFLAARGPAWRAVLLSAGLFAVVHADRPHPALLLIPFGLGVLNGVATIRFESIWPAVVVHAAWNGASCVVLTAFEAVNDVGVGFLVALSVLLLVAGFIGWTAQWRALRVRGSSRAAVPPAPSNRNRRGTGTGR